LKRKTVLPDSMVAKLALEAINFLFLFYSIAELRRF
jgi:hypothetical protein